MDELQAEVVVNREEPIPALNVSGNGGSTDGEGKRDKLKAKLQDARAAATGTGHSLQDRFFSKLLQQVIPPEEINDGYLEPDPRSTNYINRPGFSLPLMTKNFRRFNARIGVVFVFQARLTRILTWRKTSHTLSFFAVYSFVCLNPYLLSVLPLAAALFFLLIPAFLTRHPPPPSPAVTVESAQYSIAGPPLAPARIIKPAAEMSKDFFRNMRDLQNSMDDFSTVHDAFLASVTSSTNFSNEPLSSTIFLFLFVTTCLLFLTSHLLPWRLILLLSGWAAIALGHPKIQDMMFRKVYKTHIRPASTKARSWLDIWISNDIIMDSAPEKREVEIFELQRRKGNSNSSAGEWESWIFSASIWEPMAPARIAGERVKGTRFFEDVVAPGGWEWEGPKWELDLGSQEWVEQRLVGGVEVEVEGERWVYDIAQEEKVEEDEDEDGLRNRRGEWRRRRWVRMVRRKVLSVVSSRNTLRDDRKGGGG